MPNYDYICEKCEKVQEVFMSMKDVGSVDVYCTLCSQTSFGINSDGKIGPLDVSKASPMRRHYTPGALQQGVIKGKTIGSLMESKKFRKSNKRPEEYFKENLAKKQDFYQKVQDREKETGKTINVKFKDID